MIKYLYGISFFFVCVAFFSSCESDNGETLYPVQPVCDTAKMTYDTTIKPIIVANCLGSGCHSDPFPGGGYNFETYTGVVVAIGNNNKFLKSVKHEAGVSAMPKGLAKLSDCDISKLEAWIKRGYPEK